MSPILLPIKEFISENNVREADNLIIELQKRTDLKLIGELLELLDDNCKYDELMYSIIHATETMEDSAFVNNFLERAEDLLKTSPKWAGVLLIRIVNNKNKNTNSTLRELLSNNLQMKTVINKIREYSLEIKQDMPVF